MAASPLGVAERARRCGSMLLLLAVLSGCAHRSPGALMLIEVHEEQCAAEACVQAAARLQKLLTVQLALRSDCAGVQVFVSRDQWMLASTPPTAKHWTLTVFQSLGSAASQPTWLLLAPGKNYRGSGGPSQIVKDACALAD